MFPAISLSPAAILADMTVFGGRLELGLKLIVLSFSSAVPAMLPPERVIIEELKLEGLTVSENVARMAALIGKPVLESVGEVFATDGGVRSTSALVENVIVIGEEGD